MFGCILLYMTIRNTFSVYKIFVLFKLHSIFLLFTINNNKSNIKFSTNIFSFFSLFVFFFHYDFVYTIKIYKQPKHNDIWPGTEWLQWRMHTITIE